MVADRDPPRDPPQPMPCRIRSATTQSLVEVGDARMHYERSLSRNWGNASASTALCAILFTPTQAKRWPTHSSPTVAASTSRRLRLARSSSTTGTCEHSSRPTETPRPSRRAQRGGQRAIARRPAIDRDFTQAQTAPQPRRTQSNRLRTEHELKPRRQRVRVVRMLGVALLDTLRAAKHCRTLSEHVR